MRDHHWPGLIVATETPLGVRRNVIGENSMWGGRALKAGFGQFIPADHCGPVAWVDADCEARGEFQGLPDLDDAVHGLAWGRRIMTSKGIIQLIHSTILLFPSADLARRVSERWIGYLRKQASQRTDEIALMRALEGIPTRAIDGTHEWPLPHLWHDGANSRLVNGRMG
jgi:hypothetical protein